VSQEITNQADWNAHLDAYPALATYFQTLGASLLGAELSRMTGQPVTPEGTPVEHFDAACLLITSLCGEDMATLFQSVVPMRPVIASHFCDDHIGDTALSSALFYWFMLVARGAETMATGDVTAWPMDTVPSLPQHDGFDA
jgi:hypothetical protein